VLGALTSCSGVFRRIMSRWGVGVLREKGESRLDRMYVEAYQFQDLVRTPDKMFGARG
jgi:hypothetical protein